MPLLVPVPAGLVTVILPVSLFPTVALMLVALTTVKATTAVPPNATALVVKSVPEKLVPVMVTTVLAPPLVGVNELIVGGGITVKFIELVAVPYGVITVIGPLVVPACTIAVMVFRLTQLKIDAVPLNFT